MPPSAPPCEFAAPVLRLDSGMNYHYLPIPNDLADEYQHAGVRRVVCKLNGHRVRRAIQGRQDGERYLIVGLAILRDIGAELGDMVAVTMEPDPDPDQVDLGEEFEAALEQDAQAAERFYAMTPGRQRSMAYYVTSAKRSETRIKRALELAHKLRTYTLYGDTRGEK